MAPKINKFEKGTHSLSMINLLPSSALLLLLAAAAALVPPALSGWDFCPAGSSSPCTPNTNEACGLPKRGGPAFHFRDSTCGMNDPNGPFYDPVHKLYAAAPHLFSSRLRSPKLTFNSYLPERAHAQHTRTRYI